MKNRVLHIASLLLLFNLFAQAQKTNRYEIDVTAPAKKIVNNHLDLGGINPNGDQITINSFFIKYNEKPFFPIIGEFHYSRYPSLYWEESILKMKSGGINTVATYVFWNIHERKEAVFDWTGDLNLRRFVELCEKHGLYVIVRLGPFCHGEIRNGGLPDWLYGRPFDVRSNDPAYLSYTKKLYDQIYSQIQGKLFKDGGPIIGVQLENEYQHSAAQWNLYYLGSQKEYTVAQQDINVTHAGVSISEAENLHAEYGRDHMANLKKIAKDAGIDVPIYTATGWGNASIVEKGSLPVTAAYAYPTWTKRVPSDFYLYKDIHKNPDYSPVSFEAELYPSLPAEMGSGIMITNARRPTVVPESVEPLMVRTIGSGSNGIGYYMYHGGSTPVFDGHFYSEEVGGLPKISYDFQAPLGEYGQPSYSYHTLKLLHLFLDSYGELLAPMQTILPQTNADIKKTDPSILRYAIRSKGHSGFVFMHNFQDHVDLQDLDNLQIQIKTEKNVIAIPQEGTFALKNQTSAILPFNLDLDGIKIKYATVQPLTVLEDKGGKHYIFFSNEGIDPEFVIEGSKVLKINGNNCRINRKKDVLTIKGQTNSVFSFSISDAHFLVVPRSMALNIWKHDKDKVFFTKATLLQQSNQYELISKSLERAEVLIYPASKLGMTVSGAQAQKIKSLYPEMSAYRIDFDKITPEIEVVKHTNNRFSIKAESSLGGLNDIIMRIDYTGDRGMGFIDGNLVTDHFYHGEPWELGLRKFLSRLQEKEMLLLFHPIQKGAEYLIDFNESQLPDFKEQNSFLRVGDIGFLSEYKAIITLK